MPSTSQYALPYPAVTDPPNGPQQIKDLATATDPALAGIDTRLVSVESATARGARQNLSLPSGLEAHSTTPQALPVGDRVYLRGSVQATSGAAIPSNTILATLSDQSLRPAQEYRFAVGCGYGGARTEGTVQIGVGTDGSVTLYEQDPGGGPDWVGFDGVMYWLD